MKGALIGSNTKGSSALEILIALGVLILGLMGVVGISFGNQSLTTDSETAREALRIASLSVEGERARSRNNFPGVTSTSSVENIYSTEVAVNDLTPCLKKIASRVEWLIGIRPQFVELETNLADISGSLALGGDCAADAPAGTWSSPQTFGSIDLGPGSEATDIDVSENIAYMTATASSASRPDFFLVDVANAPSPAILGSLNTGPGLNALDVMRNNATGEHFAFAAANQTTLQFQVIDASNPHSPTLLASRNLAGATGTNAQGRSIFYYDEHAYIGTNYLPAIGAPRPEFHIFNVSNPANPVEIGSFDVQHNIEAITVRGEYAYLATSDDNGEVWVLDISNGASPAFVSKFNAVGNENGTSIYLIGNRLYLGREHGASGRPDFYILNVENLISMTEIASLNLSLSPSTAEVTDIRVLGNFAFLSTSDANEEFQVLDISNPPTSLSPLVSTFNFPQNATALDYEYGRVYAAVRSNDGLRIMSNP